MTRTVCDSILKDSNGDINDHLRNHIHLTNCIHLKNHMHNNSPMMADRSLMRDLLMLRRSRSLRDPSMSPPSWQSPSALDLLSRRGEKEDAIVGNGRWSTGTERQRNRRGLSANSPPTPSPHTSKLAPGDGSVNSVVRESRRKKREDSSGRKSISGSKVDSSDNTYNLVQNIFPEKSETREKNMKQKARKNKQDDHFQTLSEKLNEVPVGSDHVASSHNGFRGRHAQCDKSAEEAEASIPSRHTGLNKVKRRKFRAGRRTRATTASRDGGAQNEISIASNSLAQAVTHPKSHIQEGEDKYGEQNVTRAPRNGCGIPWNWSRIHDRGKTFLDIAGRSFSCGLSDSKSKRGVPLPPGRDFSNMPVTSDQSSSSTRSDGEAMPLLIDGSQESSENAAWVHDYSGELGIFADNLLKHEFDFDLASEARSGDQLDKFHGRVNSRHQNLSQKYMPRTFRDLVGQNLVVQALSNAVAKRKVGLLYVFYGPHGTGKTSCARIFARALNCQSMEHPRPCGCCSSCVAHDMGKSRNIKEVGPVRNLDFKSIMEALENMVVSQVPLQYRVFVFDDCDTLPPDCWSAISMVIDRAPRRMVFVFVSSSLDVLPHIIISRCQKFFFPKLKDADIIYTLQWIATKEDFEIDKDALKLIASRSDGSLRDAEMTLEQLSLLGQRISVPLVQELVGLISDEKLVDLLDLALSADTVNTVKNLREIMESGVEPLALMSQLATVITDILAGSYVFLKARPRRKFFRRQALSKEDMEKLRLALRTLSEAEKQLRMSNDKLTWLTAALLQLAPDQQYMLPSSSADTSLNHSPLGLNNASGREGPRNSNVEHAEMPGQRGFSTNVRMENPQAGSSKDVHTKIKGHSSLDRKGYAASGNVPLQRFVISAERNRDRSSQFPGRYHQEIEEIWLEVLENIQTNSIREFLYQEGKLVSISFAAAPSVQLIFSSHVTKTKAEKFRAQLLQAFEYVLGSSVTIEIRCESSNDIRAGVNLPLMLPASQEGPSHIYPHPGPVSSNKTPLLGHDDVNGRIMKDRDYMATGQMIYFDPNSVRKSEIVEIDPSLRKPKRNGPNEHANDKTQFDGRVVEGARMGEVASSQNKPATAFHPEQRRLEEQSRSQSLVRGKVSLAHVIQQAETVTQRSGWSQRKGVSIAEKLEQENLRLEPRSRSLLCWRASRVTRRKLSRLKVRARRSQTLLRFVSCGKCLSARSPRKRCVSLGKLESSIIFLLTSFE